MSSIIGSPIIAGGGGLELVANVANGATVTATLGSKTVTGVSVGVVDVALVRASPSTPVSYLPQHIFSYVLCFHTYNV